MTDGSEATPSPRYRWYVLTLLTAALAFSLIDRQIVTILAGPIKADLGLSDAELGLLYGTAFAVFYSLFGVALGRLADSWSRTRLLALGLFLWSLMTMASGFAANLVQLAGARIGVGIGEATANPVAYSLISHYFSKERRATAVAIYSNGVSIGIGVSVVAGGGIVALWDLWFGGGGAPLGLKGWQAAFVICGAPGLILAAMFLALREPPRADAAPRRPWSRFAAEVLAMVPPLTLANLAFLRVPARMWRTHILVALGIVLSTAGLIALANGVAPPEKRRVLFELMGYGITSHTVQWTAIGIGVYGVFSWAQTLKLRDAPAFELICRTPVTVALLAVCALEMMINYGLTGWSPFYAVGAFHRPLPVVALEVGAAAATAGLIGTTLGGFLADYFRRRSPRGRLYVSLFAVVVPVPLVPVAFSADTLEGFCLWWLPLGTIVTAWYAGAVTAIQDLVLPRMRGTAAAVGTLCVTMFGLGTGPYIVGLISDITGDLGFAIMSMYALIPIIAALLIFAIRGVERAEATAPDRAREAGEPG